MVGFNELSSFVSDPHFKDYLSNFNVPRWVYITLATIALLTWLSQSRDTNA